MSEKITTIAQARDILKIATTVQVHVSMVGYVTVTKKALKKALNDLEPLMKARDLPKEPELDGFYYYGDGQKRLCLG